MNPLLLLSAWFCSVSVIAAVIPPLAEEREALTGLKARELERLEASFEKPPSFLRQPDDVENWRRVTLREIAALHSRESLPFFTRLYRQASPEDAESLLLAFMRNPDPDIEPLLLQALHTEHRDTAARVLAHVVGTKAIPELREVLQKDASSDITLRSVLVQLGDRRTTQELNESLKNPAVDDTMLGTWLDQACLAPDKTVLLPTVRRLFAAIDWQNGQQLLELKVRVGTTLLCMGDRESLPEIARFAEKLAGEGLDTPSASLARGLFGMLEKVTKHPIQRDGSDAGTWLDWWSAEGSKEGLFPAMFQTPMPPDERMEIQRSVIAWARTKPTGPIIGPVAYLCRESVDIRLDSDTERVYWRSELKLLEVVGFDIDSIESNGSHAFAILAEATPTVGGKSVLPGARPPRVQLELRREGGQWRVDGTVPLTNVQ